MQPALPFSMCYSVGSHNLGHTPVKSKQPISVFPDFASSYLFNQDNDDDGDEDDGDEDDDDGDEDDEDGDDDDDEDDDDPDADGGTD